MGLSTAPEPLGRRHDISQFNSGVSSIDTWLQSKAHLNETKGGARTYVICDGERVVGFYSLAASAVEKRRLSSRVSRNMPEPVPVILLGQLAVDTRHQGMGLGVGLLADAVRRSLVAANLIGARAVVVQAVNERAKNFYERFGFRPFSDREAFMLAVRMSEVREVLVA